MHDSAVRLRIEGPIAHVELARAAKLHALTPSMLDELDRCAQQLDANPDLRVVVLSAEGLRAFCVGADIDAWSALSPLDMWRLWVRRGHQVFDRWACLRQPVIAAIQGAAFGGGLELALAADLRIAATTAQFALPESSIGTCPGWSGSQRLVSLIGASRAKYLALSGERMDAGAALQAGLVHELVPPQDLPARVQALALQMAGKAPIALQLTKQLVNAAAGQGRGEALEAMAGALAATTSDAAEGVRSFKERRAPHYTGR